MISVAFLGFSLAVQQSPCNFNAINGKIRLGSEITFSQTLFSTNQIPVNSHIAQKSSTGGLPAGPGESGPWPGILLDPFCAGVLSSPEEKHTAGSSPTNR